MLDLLHLSLQLQSVLPWCSVGDYKGVKGCLGIDDIGDYRNRGYGLRYACLILRRRMEIVVVSMIPTRPMRLHGLVDISKPSLSACSVSSASSTFHSILMILAADRKGNPMSSPEHSHLHQNMSTSYVGTTIRKTCLSLSMSVVCEEKISLAYS